MDGQMSSDGMGQGGVGEGFVRKARQPSVRRGGGFPNPRASRGRKGQCATKKGKVSAEEQEEAVGRWQVVGGRWQVVGDRW